MRCHSTAVAPISSPPAVRNDGSSATAATGLPSPMLTTGWAPRVTVWAG